MCGICGILQRQGDTVVNIENLKKMAGTIIHRGPDDEGYHIDRNLGFAFRRLSIIDLHGGHQPLCNEDGSIWIIFNGEIYNFKELRRELLAKGHTFSTNTDTETIVHLYEEMGPKCVDRLRGMFAFTIWDAKNKTLFCARDRFGIKPFFYHLDDSLFLWGSEIKSILPMINTSELDIEAFEYYVTYGYTPVDQSIYRSIRKLPPGHTLTIKENESPRIERYWNIKFNPDESIDEEVWKEKILAKLKESIELRLISDVPLGAFLSGGIDSGSVVALMSQIMNQPVKTFSIGFAEKAYNELPKARLVAEAFQTDHHELILEPQSVDILPTLVSSYDEPFSDPSAIPTYFVSKFARESVTVALSGDGGDELFAGYDHYRKLMRINQFHGLTGGTLIPVFKLLHKLLPTKVKGNGLAYHLSRPQKSFAAYISKWQETERATAYHQDVLSALDGSRGEKIKETILNESLAPDFLTRIQELDMRTWLVDDILTKVDRASMMNSLEVRVPILDHEFAELTFNIPSSLKLRANKGKYIFKEAVKHLLPPKIMSQSKKGFTVPLNMWFKGDLKVYLKESLLDGQNPLNDYFDQKYIETLISDHGSGMRDLNQKIWSMVVLSQWLTSQKTTT